MPKSIQAKLLRVIQDGVVRRVGSEKTDAIVNVRFIASTNRNPEEAVAAGLLREDLYYGSAWYRSICRRCAIVRATFGCSRSISCRTTGRGTAIPASRSRSSPTPACARCGPVLEGQRPGAPERRGAHGRVAGAGPRYAGRHSRVGARQ